MATTVIFDTHAYVKQLEAVGFTEAQAEVQAAALAGLVNDQVATKQDLRELELRLKHDLTVRPGAMIAAGIAIVGVVQAAIVAMLVRLV